MHHLLPLILAAAVLTGCAGSRTDSDSIPRGAVAEEMELVLSEMLERWYPAIVDSVHGGYLSTLTRDWRPTGAQNKMIVTQGRHTWTTARAADFYDNGRQYLPMSSHGYRFLRDEMWDDVHGGFFWLVSREGEPIPEDGALLKRAYGEAFAIYGLAALYRASGNQGALDLAKEAFYWLEQHSHDPIHGGYFQFLTREGVPYEDGYAGTPPKDQNSSIHLLEALTELYRAWPDPLVRERLDEMLHLVRDRMVTPRGYLQLFFNRDWSAVSYRDSSAVVREAHYALDHVSPGHDVETAYLMLDAEEALGRPLNPTTLHIAKKMVDHALRTGWDVETGGFIDRGYYFSDDAEMEVLLATKNWWAQAEGLNALLMMHELYPDDPAAYGDHFLQLWRYVQVYLIDPEYGGWFASGLDREPESVEGDKGHIWKSPYHTGRALMECIHRLR